MSQTLVETLKSTDWFHADGFPVAVEPRNPQLPFADSNYFSRLFNTTMGQAPTTYRRRLLAEQTVLSEQRGSGHLHNHAAISWQTQ